MDREGGIGKVKMLVWLSMVFISGLIMCVVLAVAVRLGDYILGW